MTFPLKLRLTICAAHKADSPGSSATKEEMSSSQLRLSLTTLVALARKFTKGDARSEKSYVNFDNQL